MAIHSGRNTKYGQNLRAYIVYLLIEMRLSNQRIREHVATVFNIAITTTTAHDAKMRKFHLWVPSDCSAARTAKEHTQAPEKG